MSCGTKGAWLQDPIVARLHALFLTQVEPHISCKLFPLPARDVIPVPRKLERVTSAPVIRTMETPQVGRRMKRQGAYGVSPKLHRSPWTPYRLFELCLSNHNLFHAIRLLTLAWQDGSRNESSNSTVIRTYALSLELLYHSLSHCNIRCAVQCWSFAYRMESVLHKSALVPLSTDVSSVSAHGLPLKLISYRRSVFREATDTWSVPASPISSTPAQDPVSWLMTSTGTLMWGVASTLGSAVRGAQTYLHAPELASDPALEVVDPSEVYADILSPTLLVSLKFLDFLLRGGAYYPCAVITQNICVAVDQFPSHLTSELMLLNTLHGLIARGGSTANATSNSNSASSSSHDEFAIDSIHHRLQALCESFQLYNLALATFETKFRRVPQPEFLIRERCLGSMVSRNGHMMFDGVDDRVRLERKVSTESMDTISMQSLADLESVISTASGFRSPDVPVFHFDTPRGMNVTVESLLQWLCRASILVGSLPTAAFLALLLGDMDALSMTLSLFLLNSLKEAAEDRVSTPSLQDISTRAKVCARALLVAIDRTDTLPRTSQHVTPSVGGVITSDLPELPRELTGRVLATVALVTSRAGSVRHVRDIIELVCGIMCEPLTVAH